MSQGEREHETSSDDVPTKSLLYYLLGDLRAPWADLEREHPRVVHAIWRWSLPLLLLLAAADLLVDHHGHFGYDGLPGFYSVYGLLACIVMVVFSKKVVALFLKRNDTYYDTSEERIDNHAAPDTTTTDGGHR